ncbi:DUF4412 domain-containing protein [Halocola ammonii]
MHALKSLTLLMAVVFTTVGICQKPFEGLITFDVKYNELSPELKTYESSLPQQASVYFKGSKIRMEQTTAFGKQIVITDQENEQVFMLMDMLGQKIALQIPREDYQMKVENMKDQRIDYVEETKTFAGIECEKAIVTDATNGKKLTVFYTTLFENPGDKFIALKGFPLFYQETSSNSVSMELKAVTIEEQPVDDQLFDIPAEYKIMTREEMQQSFMGLGQ